MFVYVFGRLCSDLLKQIQNMLHGLVKYEGLQQQLRNLNDQLSDLNNLISEAVNKQNKVQYIGTDSTKLTYEYISKQNC